MVLSGNGLCNTLPSMSAFPASILSRQAQKSRHERSGVSDMIHVIVARETTMPTVSRFRIRVLLGGAVR